MNNNAIYSTMVRSGKTTYFIDAKEAKNGNKYPMISETRLDGDEKRRSSIRVFGETIASSNRRRGGGSGSAIGMKYCLRTVTWKFQESTEALPDVRSRASLFIRSPEDLYSNYGSLFKDQVRERFVVFWLDATNKVMGWEIATGSQHASQDVSRTSSPDCPTVPRHT